MVFIKCDSAVVFSGICLFVDRNGNSISNEKDPNLIFALILCDDIEITLSKHI